MSVEDPFLNPAASLGTIKEPLETDRKAGTLTIALIVKDEASNIREAIESFRPVADEIVVNDTGSTDGTQALLEELGVTWFQSDWCDDFSLARNQGLEHAKSAWVLWMDADDRIPQDQVQYFLKLKTAPLDRVFGFQVINTQAGRAWGSRFMQIRMFPNHPRLRFRNRVHEQIIHSAAELGLHCFYTETTIHHRGYEDEAVKRRKAERNLRILEQEGTLVNRDPALSMSEGDSWYILGQWEKGIQAYERTLAIPGCESLQADVYAELPICIGRGHQNLGRHVTSVKWFDKAIASRPEKMEPYYYKAESLLHIGKAPEAAELFRKILEMPLRFSSTSNQYDVIRIYSYYRLASILASRRQHSEAADLLARMHGEYKEVVESWELLGRCRIELGEPREAIEALSRAVKLGPAHSEETHRLLLQLLEQEKDSRHAEHLDLAKRHFPGLAASRETWKVARPLLSLCMIVKNEASRLAACLDSVAGLADETVIVDTGSEDGTQQLAKDRGARVIQSTWESDFSKARNLSLAEAKGKWLLWLDADDILLEDDRKALRRFIEDAEKRGDRKAFGLLVKNSSDSGVTGTVFNQIRLFPNLPGLRFRSPVHEQILPAIEEAGLAVDYLPIKVIHTGYAHPEDARAKQVRNRDILEHQVSTGKDVTSVTLYTLACAHLDLGDPRKALTLFEQAADNSRAKGNNPHIAAIGPVKAAICLASQGRHADALERLEQQHRGKGWQSAPAEGWLVRAQVEKALQRDDEARLWFERLLGRKEEQSFTPMDFQLAKIQALEFLAHYWKNRGRMELALFLLKAGLAIKAGRDFTLEELRACYGAMGGVQSLA